ncbi:hypothetical protein CFC21_097018, partial [Triticum aestivum]
SE